MRSASLKLKVSEWDIQLDDKGNIDIADNPYSVAQDVGCVVSTFEGECFANTSIGIPYDSTEINQLQYLSHLIENEALRLDMVIDAKCRLYFMPNEKKQRILTGVITIRDVNNVTTTINL